jgi:hypothetical protein
VPPMRDVQGLGQSRHSCCGQRRETSEDMNNRSILDGATAPLGFTE